MSAPDPIGDKIERELRAQHEQRRNQWDRLFAEWLTNRAEYMHPDTSFVNCEAEQTANDRQDELARLITTTPAVEPWMILRKIQVLEYYLGGVEDGTAWNDNREVVMLAGIKADLLRFEPK